MPKAGERIPAPSPLGGRIHAVRGRATMLDSDVAEVRCYALLAKARPQGEPKAKKGQVFEYFPKDGAVLV